LGLSGRFADRRVATVRSLCDAAAIHDRACGREKWRCCREWPKKVFTLFDASPSDRGSSAGIR